VRIFSVIYILASVSKINKNVKLEELNGFIRLRLMSQIMESLSIFLNCLVGKKIVEKKMQANKMDKNIREWEMFFFFFKCLILRERTLNLLFKDLIFWNNLGLTMDNENRMVFHPVPDNGNFWKDSKFWILCNSSHIFRPVRNFLNTRQFLGF
jgi:hypothetical protein